MSADRTVGRAYVDRLRACFAGGKSHVDSREEATQEAARVARELGLVDEAGRLCGALTTTQVLEVVR